MASFLLILRPMRKLRRGAIAGPHFCAHHLWIATVILAFSWIGSVSGQSLVRVPADAGNLQDALARVADGGTVELSSGIYTAPSGGFTNPAGKGMTIQAASGASVTLSGGGHDIFRFTNAKRDQGKPITFMGLRFADGVSNQAFIGGGLTLGESEAIFKGCSFLNNNTVDVTKPGGGGALFIAGSVVTFDGCVFIGNTSATGGGAITALESRLYIVGCHFTGNRCDLPGHSPSAPGGGVYSYDSQLEISSSVFEDNHAGYVGGAVYDAAPWTSTEKLVEIKNCLFYNNGALRDASVSFGAPALGGAVHVEENITLNVYSCNFTNNVSMQAGAISTYRSVASIDHCLFRGNKGLALGTNGEGTGGAITALSADGAGEPNRRSITLNVIDCFFIGANDGTPDAKQGGQIFAGGDRNAAYGLNGVPQNGTVDSNRGRLNLQRVAFYKSRVDSSNSIPARGSSVVGDFARIEADNVLFLEGDAGSGSSALSALSDSVAHLRKCVFQKNNAHSTVVESYSAAVTQFGGELTINDSNFLDNFYKPQDAGKGVDMVTSPDAGGSGGAGTDMTGLVTNCIFSGATTGGRIYDGAGTDRPFNLLQYSANQFLPASEAYISDILAKTDVTGLNNFTATFRDGSSIKKAPAANTAPRALPDSGQILSYSIKAPLVGDPSGSIATTNLLAYSATSNCTIDGIARGTDGVIDSTAGAHTLVVGAQGYTVNPEKNVAANISTRLQVGTGADVLIGGFIIQGTVPKRVAIRGIGPSLAAVGLTGVLANPTIELHDQSGAIVAQNDDWQGSDQRIDLVGSRLAPADPAEAALIAALNPGNYTVVLQGVGGGTGIGLVEIYDLDGSKQSTLANIATRGKVQGGDQVMIGGFIVLGDNGATNVVLRGVGPTLGTFGVAGALADPLLEVYDANGALILQNDDWGGGPDASFIQAKSLAPSDSHESAVLFRNPVQGNYTAILKGKNGGTGVGLIEAFVF
jgi:predicted outer membrane repeat protein